MGKCIVCGKHGLFVKIDAQGRCNEYLKKIEKEEEARFEVYYADLISGLKNQQEFVDVGNNPIEALEFIPRLNDKIEACDPETF